MSDNDRQAAPALSPPAEGRLTTVLEVLADAARALHAEQDAAAMARWTAGAVADAVGTPEAAVCLLTRDASPEWVASPAATAGFSLLHDPRAVPLLRDPLRRGDPAAIADVAAADRGLAAPDRLGRILAVGRLLAVPVTTRDDELTGVLAAAWPEPGPIEADEVETLRALAAHLGVALDNRATLRRLEEEEARGKEVVHRLQEAVRPPAPVVPSTDLGVHYVAADPTAPTGGDLYDWVLLPEGDLHVAVVDVMGKGVEATKHALAVTHALRLLAIDGCPLGDLVRRADDLLGAQSPDLVATVIVVRYSPATGRVLLAGAGHPPALLVHGDTTVEEIAAPGIPIGWPGAGSHSVVARTLERSETLILYTDGLIEARKDILQGLESAAAAAAATASYPATSLPRVLVERQLATAARHDDTLALVLRRRTPPDTGGVPMLAPLVHRFTPSTAAVPVARHLLRDWLQRVPVDDDTIDGLLIVASELCANAVRHASGAPGSVALRAWADGDSVVVEVRDDGRADDLSLFAGASFDDELPDPEAEAGRGLFLVRQLTDDVSATSDDDGTVVRVVKRAVIGSAPTPRETRSSSSSSSARPAQSSVS